MSAMIETLLHDEPLARAGHLSVGLARGAEEIDQALALRHRVFARELGADTGEQDRDEFDAFCEHLIVRDTVRDEVVGTYRLLSPEAARRTGGLYCDREFDLQRLHALRPQMVEIGRACVHPDYRSGTVIMLLWSGLGQVFSRRGYRHVIGCASVGIEDGGARAATLYDALVVTHFAGDALRVTPRDRLRIEDFAPVADASPPPLLKGYLRAGGRLLGEPHRDAAFRCADFPMLLELDALQSRYQRRFLHE